MQKEAILSYLRGANVKVANTFICKTCFIMCTNVYLNTMLVIFFLYVDEAYSQLHIFCQIFLNFEI